MIHTACTGPITYRGQAAVQTDIANFKAALAGHRFEDTFIPAVAPGTIEIIIPGVVAHTTNCVEHPELVAERILRYAKIVGQENVVAGVDCGFAQGLATARVHPSIMWEKFRMLSAGARLASQRLWS